MKCGLAIILLALTLFTPLKVVSADNQLGMKGILSSFLLEIYYDGVKQEKPLYVDLKILNKKEVQWTTVFLNQSRCIKKNIPPPFVVSRWDEGISDVNYDSKSFQLKLKFPVGEEEVLVRGERMPNFEFKVEGAGFRKDFSTHRNIKIEWKSIHD